MDIALSWDNALGRGDWSIVDGDLLLGPALESAIAISLFTDAAAPAAGLSGPGSQGVARRGWWADRFASVPIGSLLYLAMLTPWSGGSGPDLVAQAACTTALQWMLDDGVAASVTVVCTRAARDALSIVVTVTEPTGGPPAVFTYAVAWAEV